MLTTPERSENQRGVVVVYPGPTCRPEHERISQLEVAKRLAALQGLAFAGEYSSTASYAGRVYFVPTETITDKEEAHRLGIVSESDLFGGVVPQPFAATKAVTHPIVSPDAYAPAGWSSDFAERVQDSVLKGLSAFTLKDAHEAGSRLLKHGPVRIKPVRATAGRGQSAVYNPEELALALDALNTEELKGHGVVLEEHLDEVTTYSVGQVQVADLVVTYYGTQRLTSDNDGETVYGGSDLMVVRGGFETLLDLDMSDEARLAVAQAQTYDTAALDCFPGLCASRRNYDVAQGMDVEGRRRSGVLEQSWRIGGASSAEVMALEAFQPAPELRFVRASSLEIYGEDTPVPADATVLFRGADKDVGFITKCVRVEPYDRT
jgi:hypothetical protein